MRFLYYKILEHSQILVTLNKYVASYPKLSDKIITFHAADYMNPKCLNDDSFNIANGYPNKYVSLANTNCKAKFYTI